MELVDWSCITCGAHWSKGVYSEDCEECGGGAMARACPVCGGKCEKIWNRAPLDVCRAWYTGRTREADMSLNRKPAVIGRKGNANTRQGLVQQWAV